MGTVKLSTLYLNDGTRGLPKNPRFIRDEKFKKLCGSIKNNPEFMPARPIIVDENGVILGGNMRFRACKELGMKDIPASWVQRVEGWPVEKKRRFIILDNRGFGEDDMDMLANEWDVDELIAAGFDEKELTGIEEETEEDKDGVPDRDPNIMIRISVPAPVWIGKRDEILGICERMKSTYLADVKVDE